MPAHHAMTASIMVAPDILQNTMIIVTRLKKTFISGNFLESLMYIHSPMFIRKALYTYFKKTTMEP